MSLSPKKTDAIEVRVSPEEKVLLKQAATKRGLTVSGLIRERLADVLGAVGQARSARMSEIAKRTGRVLLTRPGLMGMAAAAAFGVVVVLTSSAGIASAVQMDVSAEVAGAGGINSASRSLAIEEGQTVELEVRGLSPAELYRFRISASAAEEGALVSSEILHVADGAESLLASPRVMVAYGAPADIVIGGADAPQLSVRIVVERP